MKRSEFSIRPLDKGDEPFLREALYHALHVPDGADPLPLNIVETPEIRRYIEGWGQNEDSGFVAIDETDRRPVGAAWIRQLNGDNKGYGYVDDGIPELSIAVLPPYRGRGVGTKLLARLLLEAQDKYRAISLSVSSDNPAVRLYERNGFRTVKKLDASLIMVRSFNAFSKGRTDAAGEN